MSLKNGNHRTPCCTEWISWRASRPCSTDKTHTPIGSMEKYQTPSLSLQCWLPADALTTTRIVLAHAHEDEQLNAGGKGNRSEAVRDKLNNYTSYTIARKKNRLVQQNIISKANTVGCVNGKHNIFIHQVKAKLTKKQRACACNAGLWPMC